MNYSLLFRNAAITALTVLAASCAGSREYVAVDPQPFAPPEGTPIAAEVQDDPGIVGLIVEDPVSPGGWVENEELSGASSIGSKQRLPVDQASLRFAGVEPGSVAPRSGRKSSTGAGTTHLAALDPLNDVAYDMPVEVNEAVHTYLEYFQTRLRDTFSRYLIRSGRYIPLMQEIFREHGIPEDMVYLSMIESGFNPYAYSRARASGAWQFISSTGKLYGLRQDYWVDERRDVVLATHAAAKYLSDLYNRFGDWYLALASYNAGEGRVAASLRSSNSTTFWELREKLALPQETRDYVPKFIAAMLIAKSPEEYGFFVQQHAPLVYDTVTVDGATDLEAIARATGVPVEEIKFLNPQLRRDLTPPDKSAYTVYLPQGKKRQFAHNFPAIQAQEQRAWAKKASSMGSPQTVRHRVRRGETLSVIADKYRTRVSRIQSANNMGRRTMIREGQLLVIPVGSHYASASRSGGSTTHRVRRGDSLWKIASRYNVRLRDLLAWNGLSSDSVLHVGQQIIIK